MVLPTGVLSALRNIVGSEGMLTSSLDLAAYSFDGTTNWRGTPQVVVFPTTAEQVSAILRLANKQGIAVTPRGAGTNLSGGSIPTNAGIVLCTTRMNRILEIDAANLTATIEAGVVLNDLNLALSGQRLFFPPDPQSFLAATIGGCVSENAGGPYAVKYGVFKHYLLGMRAVLPSGVIIDLGGRTVKNVTGYDLPQLVCGSEGTLAVITQVTVRLLPQPATRQTVLAVFDQVVKAGEAVRRIRKSGIIPAKIELMDNWIIRRIEEMMSLGLPTDADAILLFECDGLPETVMKECAAIIDLSKESGAVRVRAAEDAREAEGFWTARRAGFSAIFGYAKTVLSEDVTVPVTRIPELIDRVRKLGRDHDLTIVIIGHAGDGNLHPSILTDIHDVDHFATAERAMESIFSAALELGGVVSGEHGIGLEKKRFLKQAMAPEAITLLRNLKKVFDPKGILNPGKIWEDV